MARGQDVQTAHIAAALSSFRVGPYTFFSRPFTSTRTALIQPRQEAYKGRTIIFRVGLFKKVYSCTGKTAERKSCKGSHGEKQNRTSAIYYVGPVSDFFC